MTTENQDPQKPTTDQPPPKQYAGQQPGQSGQRGTDDRASKTPGRVESSEGDDENETASEQSADYRRSQGGDDRSTNPGQGGGRPGSKDAPKQGGQTGYGGGSGTGSQGGTGAGSSSPRTDKNR